MDLITEINSVEEFQKLLIANPGLFIIKFGAEWCGPCKIIERDVQIFFRGAPPHVQCAMIDIDKCPALYGFLKSKKMLNGVPAILCYYKGNNSFIPDDFIIGANTHELHLFFDRCKYQSVKE